MKIVQLLVNGVLLGSVYAMVGLGMSMIFGIIGLTNLAHGELVVLGAYFSTLLAQAMGVDPVLTLVVTVPAMFLLGMGLQHLLINRAMARGGEPALLVTFGLSIILQDAMLMLFSADARHAATPYSTRTLRVAGLNIACLDVVLFLICLACVLGLTLFLRRTYTGRAIRALSDDRTAASLVGINVQRVYDIAMGVALATAAVAGLCWSIHSYNTWSMRAPMGANGHKVSSRSRVMAWTGKFTRPFYSRDPGRAPRNGSFQQLGPALGAIQPRQHQLDADQQRHRQQQADHAPQPTEHHQGQDQDQR